MVYTTPYTQTLKIRVQVAGFRTEGSGFKVKVSSSSSGAMWAREMQGPEGSYWSIS